MKRTILVLAVCGLVTVALGAASPAASADPQTRPAGGELGTALQVVLDAGAPGAIALVRHGASIRHAAVGVADRASGRLMDPADHFRIGSVTKTFVATVVLQLTAERQLRLDDTVETLLPGALPYGNRITMRQILNHTSGVPDYLPAVAQIWAEQPSSLLRTWTPEQLLGMVAAAPPVFPAGQQWQYSNTNYILAGMIIERVTGRSLAAEIDRRILRPLQLRDTSFPTDTANIPAPAAQGYLAAADGTEQDVTGLNPSAAWAAGAIISTVDDVARFYRALLRGDLLPPAQLHQMLTYVYAGGISYGLGIFEVPTPCGPAIGHNGAVLGYATDVFTTRDGSRQVVLTSNQFPGDALAAQEALIGDLLCDPTTTVERQSLSTPLPRDRVELLATASAPGSGGAR
jgi:D-alanyl-D-alanine carboxypeptidase